MNMKRNGIDAETIQQLFTKEALLVEISSNIQRKERRTCDV